MAERTRYTPGTFSWTDLTTTDQEGAKAFYGELFEWDTADMPVQEGVYYSIARIAGKDIAAISPQPQQQRDAGAPSTWNSYVTVDSADRALDRAQQLGATVHAPAFDVMDVGRMGVVQDPQGAFFLVWEPGSHIGASLVNAPGALCWNELATSNMDASARFYGELFGWKTAPGDGSETPYLTIRNRDGHQNGGIRPVTGPETPPHWLVYFGTEDIDASSRTVTELGGEELAAPLDIGVGRIAVVRDPQGAVFALYYGHFDD